MTDWRALNDPMVDGLVRSKYLESAPIEAAFRAVPRHVFLPGTAPEEVYSGKAIVIQKDAEGCPTSSSSEPGVMATMLEQLQPRPGQRVLEIGAGTGYNAAILAQLVGEPGEVTTIDIDEEIARRTRENLERAGFGYVVVLARDGWLGAPERAPFDAIEATVGLWDLSPHWVEQLRDGGLLLVPLRLRGWMQALTCFRKEGGVLATASVRAGGFMPFRGPHADPEEPISVNGYRVRFSEPRRDDELQVLGELLARQPETEPVRDANWWHGSYALSFWERDGVSVSHGERGMLGVFDARERSLALYEPDFAAGGKSGQFHLFGSRAALDRLRLALARGSELRGLWVEAAPIGADRTERPLVLRRRHHQFTVSRREGG